MPLLVTVSAVAMCGHGGQAKFIPAPRVKLGGTPAAAGVPPTLVIAGCANPPPPVNSGPGVSAVIVSGQTMRIRSMGLPLLTQAMATSPAVACATPVTLAFPGQVRVQGQ